MIKTFKSKGLQELWNDDKTAKIDKNKIDKKMHERIIRRLDAPDAASNVSELNMPGFDFHPLNGFDPARYSVHVNGPWCITFEFREGDAYRVDFEQYH